MKTEKEKMLSNELYNHMITSYQEHCKYKAFRSLQTRKNNI